MLRGEGIYWSLGDHDGLQIFEATDDETATTIILYLVTMGNVHASTCLAYIAAEI